MLLSWQPVIGKGTSHQPPQPSDPKKSLQHMNLMLSAELTRFFALCSFKGPNLWRKKHWMPENCKFCNILGHVSCLGRRRMRTMTKWWRTRLGSLRRTLWLCWTLATNCRAAAAWRLPLQGLRAIGLSLLKLGLYHETSGISQKEDTQTLAPTPEYAIFVLRASMATHTQIWAQTQDGSWRWAAWRPLRRGTWKAPSPNFCHKTRRCQTTCTKPDIWHNWHLGLGRYFLSSSLIVLAPLFEGDSIPARFQSMTAAWRAYCRSRKKRPLLRKITRDTLNYHGPLDWPEGGWQKADTTTLLCEPCLQ